MSNVISNATTRQPVRNDLLNKLSSRTSKSQPAFINSLKTRDPEKPADSPVGGPVPTKDTTNTTPVGGPVPTKPTGTTTPVGEPVLTIQPAPNPTTEPKNLDPKPMPAIPIGNPKVEQLAQTGNPWSITIEQRTVTATFDPSQGGNALGGLNLKDLMAWVFGESPSASPTPTPLPAPAPEPAPGPAPAPAPTPGSSPSSGGVGAIINWVGAIINWDPIKGSTGDKPVGAPVPATGGDKPAPAPAPKPAEKVDNNWGFNWKDLMGWAFGGGEQKPAIDLAEVKGGGRVHISLEMRRMTANFVDGLFDARSTKATIA